MFAFKASAKKVEVIRKGSEDGKHYDRVQQTSTLFSDKLSCLNPGSTLCSWVNPPLIGGFSADVIEQYVLDKVDSGVLNGSTKYNGTVYVTWRYTPSTDELYILMDDGK